MRIDILNDIGTIPFEEAWANKRTMDYQGQQIHFVAYHDLQNMKAAAGRPQDLADIAKLKKRNEPA